MTRPAAYLGVDLGTSGCRGMAIDDAGRVLAEHALPLPSSTRGQDGHVTQQPENWWQAVCDVLRALAGRLPDHDPAALSIDGTSATLLLTDDAGLPLGAGLMYDDCRARQQSGLLAGIAPPDSAVHSPTSSLAKLLWLSRDLPAATGHALHQAEWIANRLTGRWGIGDENNCLKLGYDPVQRRWPDWLDRLPIEQRLLPRVVPAGTLTGAITRELAETLGLPADLKVVAGTTDSVAAALACGLSGPGDGATALGSTLAIKLLSDKPVFAPGYGIYSHRVLGRWLVGGASNSGGAVLRQLLSDAQMASLETRLQPDKPTGLDYYPLPGIGERFPINDPSMAPRLTPRPDDPAVFFQALLEGIAAIEALGYRRLEELGAPPVQRVFTTGGGAKNRAWTLIRHGLLGVPVHQAPHEQAAYGSALLARSGRAHR